MAARKTTILIVDDDDALRRELAEQLELTDDYVVVQAGRIAEGVAKALDIKPGVILLDVELPDGDGRDACRDLRAKGVTTPILMLTGKLTEADQVRGLDSGANDYVTKPFKVAVLLARIRAHLRSHETSEDAVFQIGPYEFRPAAKVLSESSGKKVRLTDKETSILRYLYRAGQKSVSREELLREVWGYNAAVTTHTLETHIYRLRQKIEPDPALATLLLTETGGYRLKL
ncbi:MAG: response regulator transcription factor [Caulobacterales bacterium]|jgi:DNA-binding response OmpR family regulator